MPISVAKANSSHIKMDTIKSITSRLLEVISATFTYGIMPFGTIGSVVTAYFLLQSKLWFVMVSYLVWMWILDARISRQGGRSSEWVRNWKLWEYARNYFPVKMVLAPGFKLDTTKNYLFCCHPHAIIPWCGALVFINHGNSYFNPPSSHNFYTFTLDINFLFPFYRELLLAIGFCSVSAENINYVLSKPTGGNVGVLFPGGAAEAYYSKPGVYHFVLRNRKGFIKLALKNGTDIVPLLSFGEVDVLRQAGKPGSRLRYIQDRIKQLTRFFPVVYYGRAYLPIPYSVPVHVIVGVPIHVKKSENPSQEEIDILHKEYIQRLTELFEEHKHHYITNADNTTIIID